jgi:SAM-dependent methyltransferase
MPAHWHQDYERGRPGYPPEVIDLVGVPPSATVLDLGAGTGKFTRLLVSTFVRVVAVEPDDEMRRLLATLCPDADALAGSAEQIPVVDASVDAVFAAQCFHTFDDERAIPEIARVLRPRGTLVAMWNVQAGPAEPSIASVEQLLVQYWPKGWDPLDLGNKPIRYASGEWMAAFTPSLFDDLQQARLPNPQTVDREGLVAFFDSMGWIAILPDEDRLPLLDEVKSLLTSNEYVLPWETHVQWTRIAEAPRLR